MYRVETRKGVGSSFYGIQDWDRGKLECRSGEGLVD